jgi:hypothetical protein
MTEAYDPKQIEPKWQQRWQAARLFRTQEDPSKPKCYVLAFFPIPVGRRAVGWALSELHPMRRCCAADAHARLQCATPDGLGCFRLAR